MSMTTKKSFENKIFLEATVCQKHSLGPCFNYLFKKNTITMDKYNSKWAYYKRQPPLECCYNYKQFRVATQNLTSSSFAIDVLLFFLSVVVWQKNHKRYKMRKVDDHRKVVWKLNSFNSKEKLTTKLWHYI